MAIVLKDVQNLPQHWMTNQLMLKVCKQKKQELEGKDDDVDGGDEEGDEDTRELYSRSQVVRYGHGE